MDKVRILHTADLHLDNEFTAGTFPYDIRKERQRDLLGTFDRIIEIAKWQKVKILLIAGDLFEHRSIQTDTIEHVNHQFASLHNTYIFILPGNHDPFYLFYQYRKIRWSKNVHIFSDKYEKVELKDLNVVVHGIGFGYQEQKKPLLEGLRCQSSEEVNILMLHGSNMTNAPKKESNYLPFDDSDLVDSGFDYIALGHYHQYQKIKDIYGNVIAAYPGSPEPLGFDELESHGIILGDISKERNNIVMHSIAKRQYYVLDIEVSDMIDLLEMKESIYHSIIDKSPKKNLFLIRLMGHHSWQLGETVELLENQCREFAYYIHFQDYTKALYDLESLVGENTILSSYIIKMQRKLEREKDTKQKRIIKKALELGIDALKDGVGRV